MLHLLIYTSSCITQCSQRSHNKRRNLIFGHCPISPALYSSDRYVQDSKDTSRMAISLDTLFDETIIPTVYVCMSTGFLFLGMACLADFGVEAGNQGLGLIPLLIWIRLILSCGLIGSSIFNLFINLRPEYQNLTNNGMRIQLSIISSNSACLCYTLIFGLLKWLKDISVHESMTLIASEEWMRFGFNISVPLFFIIALNRSCKLHKQYVEALAALQQQQLAGLVQEQPPPAA